MSKETKRCARSLQRLVSLAAKMRHEADEFNMCRQIHERNANYGAAAVAERACELLHRFIRELEQANRGFSNAAGYQPQQPESRSDG